MSEAELRAAIANEIQARAALAYVSTWRELVHAAESMGGELARSALTALVAAGEAQLPALRAIVTPLARTALERVVGPLG